MFFTFSLPTPATTPTLFNPDTTAATATATTPTRTGAAPTGTLTRDPSSIINVAPTATVTSGDIVCPADDNTYYEVSFITQFRVLCGVFISGTFISSNRTDNMGECMTMCQEDSVCTGVYWRTSQSVIDNCEMYHGLDEQHPQVMDETTAYGAYDWIWDLSSAQSAQSAQNAQSVKGEKSAKSAKKKQKRDVEGEMRRRRKIQDGQGRA